MSTKRSSWHGAQIYAVNMLQDERRLALFLCGYAIALSIPLSESVALARAGDPSEACGIIVGQMLEQSFGALIAAAAGLGAIIASSVGGFKTAWTLLVVSVSCFILRALLTLTFDSGHCGYGLPVAPLPRPA